MCLFVLPTAASTPARGRREERTPARKAALAANMERRHGSKEATGVGLGRKSRRTAVGEELYSGSDPEPTPAPKRGEYVNGGCMVPVTILGRTLAHKWVMWLIN